MQLEKEETGKRTNATGKRRKNELVSEEKEEKEEEEEEEEEKVGSRIRRRLSAN